MSTLRWEIERSVALMLGENPDSPGFGEPLWLRESVGNAVDYFTRQCDFYETYFTYDLDGTSSVPRQRFCLADRLYKVKEIRVIQSDLVNWSSFRPGRNLHTSARLTALCPDWRTETRTGSTEQVVLALPDIYLYPQAAHTKTKGVVAYGFATYPRSWDEANPDNEPTRNDVFPLPAIALEGVKYYAATLRCIQFPSADNKIRYPMLNDRADAELGRCARASSQNRDRLQ